MYETVKVVKGYEIKRMKGTRGAYHVNVREGKGFREFHTFRTIKAATEFIINKAETGHSPRPITMATWSPMMVSQYRKERIE